MCSVSIASMPNSPVQKHERARLTSVLALAEAIRFLLIFELAV